MLDLYIFEINYNDNKNVSLPNSVIAHCNRYKDQQLISRSLFAWGKLSELLLKNYKIDMNSEEVVFSDNGKPYLRSSSIHFNLSHSNNLLTIAISDSTVGCDIEQYIDAHMVDTLSKRIFINSDANLPKLNDEQKVAYMTKKWTEYETYIKCFDAELDILGDKPIKGTNNIEYEYNTKLLTNSGHLYCIAVINVKNEKANYKEML